MNINKTTYGIIAIIILLIGGGIYYFLKDVPEATPPAPPVQTPQEDSVQFIGTGLSETIEGKKQWELNADQIKVGANKNIYDLVSLHAQIFENTGQGNIQVTAKQGQMDTAQKILTIQGDIKAVSEKGAEFGGNVIKWFIGEHRFSGEGNIQYHQNDMTIQGDKIDADQKLDTIRVTGNARVELRR